MPALETVQAFPKHNAMKSLLAGTLLLCITSIAAMALTQCDKESGRSAIHEWPADTAHHEGYVDLGLISMTLWKSNNEMNPADTERNLFTYDEAVALFGNQLPTMTQFQELMRSCRWQWVSVGFYKVTGPSGRSIILPAAGSRDCNGDYAYNRTYGFYWSSTPDGAAKAWYLNFHSNEILMYNYSRCYANSVRLVKNEQDNYHKQ
jgi:hypothetical protein